ncbi:TylF/MycF/NovP-related O-methyltransferase [Calorimonas adulescens]|uniref:Class I SAM-dependent methyltransferase n=1 Tax=Calorimonas adulescens TaxID=2606906 RepID=A0A5D8QF81_9THEO|nr:TylF/MycF/NovP-related O-methyltransferase [Calorimonas adulescens]TZE82183.1 class I SAM-dependent methyltransferase [Calorimonas adulescens]
MSELFYKYDYDINTKLNNFEKYVRRQALSRFLARYELFKLIRNVKGSIIECGVHHGGGLMAWAKLSAALEPYAIHRKVIGFDTFEGFPSMSSKDRGLYENENLKEKGFSASYNVYEELLEIIKEYDENRFLNQFSKIELIKGNATKTIPEYVVNNKHLIVALLFLDFDLYEPTKVALDILLPRIPKGGIIAFDEINNQYWPGETIALLEKFVSLNKLEIKKFDFDPNIAYIQL